MVTVGLLLRVCLKGERGVGGVGGVGGILKPHQPRHPQTRLHYYRYYPAFPGSIATCRTAAQQVADDNATTIAGYWRRCGCHAVVPVVPVVPVAPV